MIAIITPTGGRPKQMQLCAKWMKAQTYSGDVLWVIVDDCEVKTSGCVGDTFRANWTVRHCYPSPVWKNGDNTQVRNLQVGLDEVKKHKVDAVFIIEDDDYYKPMYLEFMTYALKGYCVCGETNSMYINVNLLFFKRCGNTQHCSLFQTAFTQEMIPIFEDVLRTRKKFIDIEFFKRSENTHFFKGLDLAIGIKGLPGRGGIGNGHGDGMYQLHLQKKRKEERLMYFKELLGEDYIHYLP